MADVIYGDESVADKTPPKLSALIAGKPVHGGLVANGIMTADQQVALFSVIDEYGYATLADCIAALQAHDGPVAALAALAELGVIEFDAGMPFDQHLRVWRVR